MADSATVAEQGFAVVITLDRAENLRGEALI